MHKVLGLRVVPGSEGKPDPFGSHPPPSFLSWQEWTTFPSLVSWEKQMAPGCHRKSTIPPVTPTLRWLEAAADGDAPLPISQAEGVEGTWAEASPAHPIPWAVPRGTATGMPWVVFQEHLLGVRGGCGCLL